MMGVISALISALAPAANPQPGINPLANVAVPAAPTTPAPVSGAEAPAATTEATTSVPEKPLSLSKSQTFSLRKNISYQTLKRGERFSYAKDGGLISIPVLGQSL